MNPMEALALKGTSLKIQLRKAEAAFKELFVEPVKAWLDGQPDKRATIAGIARPILVIPQIKVEPDEEAIIREFRDLVSSGNYNLQELKTLILSGAIGIGDPAALRNNMCTKCERDTGGAWLMTSRTSGHVSLQWDCVRDSKSLEDLLSLGCDLDAAIRGIAIAPISDTMVNDLTSKAAAAVEAIDAARAATQAYKKQKVR